MIDVQHKVLKSIKYNLDDITSFFKDDNRIEKIMSESRTIANWNKNDKTLMYQSITEDILSKYDINAVIHAFVSLKLSKGGTINIEIFKSIASEYYLFLKKVYDIYLLDQIYYLLASDIDINSCEFDKPFKTGSNYETVNFEVSFFQTSLNGDNEDIDIRLYNIKEFYLEQINNLLKSKKYLYKKASLNARLQEIVFSTDNYYASQMFIILNDKILQNKPRNKAKHTRFNDEMQLVLKSYQQFDL